MLRCQEPIYSTKKMAWVVEGVHMSYIYIYVKDRLATHLVPCPTSSIALLPDTCKI